MVKVEMIQSRRPLEGPKNYHTMFTVVKPLDHSLGVHILKLANSNFWFSLYLTRNEQNVRSINKWSVYMFSPTLICRHTLT